LRAEFWQNVKVPGEDATLNQSLERAGRVADFLELAELLCVDALDRDESCGCHFREEHVDPEGECLRNDDQYAYAAAWEYQGEGQAPLLNKEPLVYETVHMAKRNYK
jgi:succinate dehydrogenase / fumarate reductase flavoprotein subunit